MTLPTARNTTYANNTPILPADLNAIQDCIVGGKIPSSLFYIPASDFQVVSGAATLDGNNKWSIANAAALSASLKLLPGTRITALQFSFDGQNTGSGGGLTFILSKRAIGGAVTQLTFGTVGINNAWTLRDSIVTDNAGVPIVTASGFFYYLSFEAGGGGAPTPGPTLFDGCIVTCDRL